MQRESWERIGCWNWKLWFDQFQLFPLWKQFCLLVKQIELTYLIFKTLYWNCGIEQIEIPVFILQLKQIRRSWCYEMDFTDPGQITMFLQWKFVFSMRQVNCVGENKAIDNIVALSTSQNQLMDVAGENIVVMNNDLTLSVRLSFLRTHVPITVAFFVFVIPLIKQ